MNRLVARLVLPVALLAFLWIAPAAWGAPAWYPVGIGPSPVNAVPNENAYGASLADAAGSPRIAWFEFSNNFFKIHASGFDGTLFDPRPWRQLLNPPNPSNNNVPDPVNARDGTAPSLAMVDFPGDGRSELEPWVAWREYPTGPDGGILVSRFTGGSWQRVGAPLQLSDEQRPLGNPSLASIGGMPYVAWTEGDGSFNAQQLHVKRFDGTTWQELGTGPINLSPTEDAREPDLAGVGGVPYVAWQEKDDGGNFEIRVARFDGTAWQQVGSGPSPINRSATQDGVSPSIASVGGVPYVAWRENEPVSANEETQTYRRIVVSKFNGNSSEWEDVVGGGFLNESTTSNADSPSLTTVAPGVPHVAWVENDGTNDEVRASRLSDNGWQPLGSGASPINRNPGGDARDPDLTQIGGVPVVAWSEDDGDNNQIYVSAFGDPPRNTIRPHLTGTPVIGGRLSCSPGSWTGSPTFTYLWDRAPRSTTSANDPAWTAIDGASGQAYTVQAADLSSRVRCRVVGSSPGLGSREAVSNSLRVDAGAPVNTRPPRTLGTPITGSTLTCDPGDWTSGPDFRYRWLRDGQVIVGETSNTYLTRIPAYGVPDFDQDNEIGCEVVASNDVGSAGPIRANSLHVVWATPRIQQAPRITLSPLRSSNPLDRTAACTSGTWLRDYRQYEYSWYRNDALIAGETGNTYKITIDDLGKDLRCGVVSVNPVGRSELANSDKVLVPLPVGTEDGEILKGGGRNEYDPVNLMALSRPYKDAVGGLNVERFRRAVASETERCKNEPGVPAEAPKLKASEFYPRLRTYKLRCTLLLRNPKAVSIGPKGVVYLDAIIEWAVSENVSKKEACAVPALCPDMGYVLPPVDPTNTASLDLDLQAQLEPITPEKVLWDVNGDGRLDVECPAAAPVMRTMLAAGVWEARAVIVNRDSAQTGIFNSAKLDFSHPKPDKDLFYGVLRKAPAQPFACRTSVEPPPDPEQGPCVTQGTIGRVQLQGNLCPLYIRALDPDVIKNLAPSVRTLLQKVAESIALLRYERDDDPVVVPLTATSSLRAFGGASARRSIAGIYANTASSYASFDNRGINPLEVIPGTTLAGLKKALGNKFNKEKANFSLDQVYWAQGPVKVNGVAVLPKNGLPTLIVPTDAGKAVDTIKSMVINTPDAATALGCAGNPNVEKCPLPLAAKGPIEAKLSEAQSAGEAVLRKEIDLNGLAASLKKKAAEFTRPFKLTGVDANVKLEKDGTATLTALAEVPLLKSDKGNPITFKITLKGDREGNVRLQGIKLGPQNAKLGGVNLSDVVVEYDQGALTLQGAFLFPPNNEGIRIEKFGIDRNGELTALSLNYVAGAGSGIPIGPGAYITEVGGGFKQIGPPFILNATVGVSAGPSLGGGCPVAGIRSTLDLALGGRPSVVADVNADVLLMCFKLGRLRFHADSSPFVSVEGNAGINEGPLSINGNFFAAIDPKRGWQGGGGATLSLRDLPIVGTIGPLRGEFVISNRGAAACVQIELPFPLPDFAGGIAERFPGGRPPLTTAELVANFRAFLGCDLSEYKPLTSRTLASGAEAGAESFTIPKGAGNAVLSIEGAGGAPRVRLRSPSGRVYDFTGATNSTRVDNAMGQIVEKEDRTVVILGRTESGEWTAETADGSPSVVRVQLSNILPKPKVTGKVFGVGSSRLLKYSVAPLDGQQVRFVEQARGGAKPLKSVTGGGSGTVSFSTGEAKGAQRTIVAEVSQDGFPRANITVARYKAPNPAVGRPRGVRVRRKGTRATVKWGKATLAKSYEVVAVGSGGRRSIFFPRNRAKRVLVPGVGKREGLVVTVVPVSGAGRRGPAGRARLEAPKKKRKRSGRR